MLRAGAGTWWEGVVAWGALPGCRQGALSPDAESLLSRQHSSSRLWLGRVTAVYAEGRTAPPVTNDLFLVGTVPPIYACTHRPLVGPLVRASPILWIMGVNASLMTVPGMFDSCQCLSGALF